MKRKEEKKKERKDENKKPLWIKTSPGTLIRVKPLKFRIKPKQEIHATVKELGTNLKTGELFCDTDFKLVKDGTGEYAIKKLKKEKEKEDEKKDKKEEYTVKSVGSGWYNVLSPSGEIMNDSKLHAEKAETLREQLQSAENE